MAKKQTGSMTAVMALQQAVYQVSRAWLALQREKSPLVDEAYQGVQTITVLKDKVAAEAAAPTKKGA